MLNILVKLKDLLFRYEMSTGLAFLRHRGVGLLVVTRRNVCPASATLQKVAMRAKTPDAFILTICSENGSRAVVDVSFVSTHVSGQAIKAMHSYYTFVGETNSIF